MNKNAQTLLKHLLIEDPEVDQRIETGIEENRKGWGHILLVDDQGNSVPAATVSLQQTGHEFDFGCNAFLLQQLPEAAKNALYEERFSDLFNLAVVPFYWRDLEPRQGQTRFDADSKFIYRRPPPDLVLDFCKRHNIKPKGHPLLWHLFRPDWLSVEETDMRKSIRTRFEKIAERYRDQIPVWDVCNEAQTFIHGDPSSHLPANHVEFAFELAAEYFPDCVKTYNDDRVWYKNYGTYSPVYLLMKFLQERNHKVDALGLQFHMFENNIQDAVHYLNRRNLLNCLDLYGRLNVPINFSEVSVISRRDLGDGDAFQDLVTEKLYRLWFSHAAVNGIVWWNLVDNTAAYAPLGDETVGENRLRAGLLNYDMSPKPAYKTLMNLIHTEWKTAATLEYTEGAPNSFKGFYGDYEVDIETGNGKTSHQIHLGTDNLNKFTLTGCGSEVVK
ncbi:MAG: endo-1,4-beta-xylanase [Opitutales bacterium]